MKINLDFTKQNMYTEPENINDPVVWKRALEDHIGHLKYKEEEIKQLKEDYNCSCAESDSLLEELKEDRAKVKEFLSHLITTIEMFKKIY